VTTHRLWRSAIRAGAIALGLASVNPAQAQDAHTGQGFWSISIENDLFGAREDGHYTHGTLVSYVPASPPGWLADSAGRLPCVPCKNIDSVEFVLGQQIFTPEDIEVPVLQLDERPYAGWLYAGVSISGDRETDRPGTTSQDTVTLTFGMVGPASLGEKAQKLFHRIGGNTRPEGWEYQLDNEPGVVLTYTRSWRHSFAGTQPGGLEFDVSPHLTGALGNVYTYASSGFVWRFGRNLSSGRADTFRPGFPSAAYFDQLAGPAWHVFLGGEVRGVARNIFLDGNTFSNSHSVDKKPVVADIQVGFAIRWKKLSFTVTEVYRSKEFDGQDGADKFGAVTLAFALR